MTPSIDYKPNGHLLVDDELDITVNGLNKHQSITVHATLSEEGKHYESCGCFIADENGTVSLKRQPALSGTYTGVSSMGLFWSMVPCPGQIEGIRMMKKSKDTPFKTHVSVYNGHHTLNEQRGVSSSICSTMIERWYKYPDVVSYEVHDGNIRGKLFLPSGPGPFPGVIDLFGTVGGLTEYRSALLASRGFASLALPYFLYKDLPRAYDEISLDYFLEAINWLSSHDKVIPNGVGVIGVSRGGDLALIMAAHSPKEAINWLSSHDKVIPNGVGVIGVSRGGDLALIMAAHSPKVRAVVNINGCSFDPMVPLKYSGGDIPGLPLQLERMEVIDGAIVMKNCIVYTADDLTHAWKHGAKILNILSEDDMCSPKECIRLFKEIYPKDKTDDCRILSYPDAGHLVEPPYTPLCRMSYHKSYDVYSLWGGYPEGHAFAQEDSWRNIQQFFHEELTKQLVVSAKL